MEAPGTVTTGGPSEEGCEDIEKSHGRMSPERGGNSLQGDLECRGLSSSPVSPTRPMPVPSGACLFPPVPLLVSGLHLWCLAPASYSSSWF